MDGRLNLKVLLNEWFDYKKDDDNRRQCWVKLHCGEKDVKNCNVDTEQKLYRDGYWELR